MMPWRSNPIIKRKNKMDVMADSHIKILLVDDEEKFLFSIGQRLSLMGFDALTASSGQQALTIAQNNYVNLAIVDLKMPDMDGLVTITKLKEIHPDLKSVLLTGYGNEKVKQATEALNAGYFEKDAMGGFWNFIRSCQKEGNVIVIRPSSARPTSDAVAPGTQNIFSSSEIEVIPKSHLDRSSSQPTESTGSKRPLITETTRMIGEALAMQDLRRKIKRFAALDCSVILYGETGVGKELAARAIHELSARKDQRFMAINCGCFSNDLLIEEFLGTENATLFSGMAPKGQILGAMPGGTILLDQIEDMSPKMQLAMLKVIDRNKSPQQNGGEGAFDVRILAASNHDLGELVRAGKFREELYFRLNVVELIIPPLRERRDDIAPLSSYFLDRFNNEFNKSVETISPEVISLFLSYDFPGNVRELEHIIERAVILTEGDTLKPKHLPERFQNVVPKLSSVQHKFTSLAEKEKQYILEVLEAAGQNKSRTAEILGISRAALWRKLKQYKAEER
jgi:DNA-binding NtrC family response regulator